MPDDNDPASWEINPGSQDPDFADGSEFWVEATVDDLEILFSQYDEDDYELVLQYIQEVPEDLWEEYGEAGYPGLMEQAHPGYRPAVEEETD